MLRRFRALSRRQKALLALSAGAAGAALCYAGSKYVTPYVESLREADRQEALQALQTQQQKKEEDEEAETKVTEHFDSIQRIADTTTLPSLLPGLKSKIFSVLNVTSLTDTLKKAKDGTSPLSPSAKYAVWEQLKILSFARTLTSAWGVCLLDLFLRVQLNILGSHLYLSSALQAGQPQERRRELSQASQHAYLSFANYLPQKGVELLAEKAEAACRTVLTTVPLKAQLTHGDLCDFFTLIQDAFKAELLRASPLPAVALSRSSSPSDPDSVCAASTTSAVSQLWSACLLPPDGSPEADPSLLRAWELSKAGNGLDDDDGLGLAGSGRGEESTWRTVNAGQSDTELLGCILRETREVLLSERFALLMDQAMDVSLGVISQNLREAFAAGEGGETAANFPLAKLVPAVASAAPDLLAAPTDDPKPGSSSPRGVATALAKLHMLDSFCADLFSSV